MSRKNVLKQYQTIKNGDMSQSTVTSNVTDIRWLDSIGVQLQWSGSPVGTFSIQLSSDYNQDDQGNILNTGTWNTISLSPPPQTALGSPVYVAMQQLPAPWIRIIYTKISGTGTLQAWISGKAI